MVFKYIYLPILSLFICLATTAQTTTKSIPVIDKNKSYPKTDFTPQVETKYIPLETSKDIILGAGADVYTLTDKHIFIADILEGDVFLFDMNGKAISHFNGKGGLGYTRLAYAFYDEKNSEIFVLDKIGQKVVVYSEDGTYLRSFRMPKNLKIVRIDNFNDELLLIFHEHAMGTVLPEEKNPYMLISKKDGLLESKLNIHLENANPRYLLSNNICYSLYFHENGNCKFGNEFILSNMSSDTIYYLSENKTLTPLFVQKPTVFSDSPQICGIVTKTDKFMVISIYPYDLKVEKERADNNEPMNYEVRFILFDIETGKLSQLKNWKYIAKEIDAPENTNVKLWQAYKLVERYKLRLLQGELKEVASHLKIDDNPVIEITKFN
ncbi:6-bladed beta-propeller [Draconibacterium sediminis]|uniref:6-bladed beta-propeller n=1 Tax=Draconibacterium sediminis TaxID=1544798 RepID=A0A0D8JIJ7_9BACT|nr:6-bladed beta-propeller [Draconibacterium sediminis]KJF45683.1 hypothetical protein LH29_10190 [Draconibacterium sediminis]